MSTKKAEIELVVNDAKATQKVDSLLKKLGKAQQLGQSMARGGDGTGTGTGTGTGGSGGGGGGNSNAAQRQKLRQEQQHRSSIGGQVIQAGNLAMSAATGGVGGVAAAGAGISGMASAAALRSGARYGPHAAVAAAAAAASLGAIAKGKMTLWQNMQELAGIEGSSEIARVAGGGDVGVNSPGATAAARFGMQPGKYAEMMSQYMSAIGIQGAGSEDILGTGNRALTGDTLHRLRLGGIDPSALSSFQALGRPGGGAEGGLGGAVAGLKGALGIAAGMGLSGQGATQLLGRIAAATSNMAEQGVSLDLGTYNAAIQGLSGKRGFQGAHAARGAAKLSGIGMSAASQFGGQFSSLATMAVQAEAFRTAKNPMDAYRTMQEIGKDPLATSRAINKTLGAGSGYAYIGQGFTADQAGVLSRGVAPKTPGGFGTLLGREESVKRSSGVASRRLQALQMSQSMKTFGLLNDTIKQIDTTLIAVGNSLEGFQRGVNDLLRMFREVLR